MTPEEYRRRQAGITSALRAVLLPLVRSLRGRPTDREWRAFLDAAYAAIVRARAESWEVAADFYAAQRRAQLGAAPADDPPSPPDNPPEDHGDAEPGRLTPVPDHGDGTADVPRRNYPPRAVNSAYRRVRAQLDALDDDEAVPPGLAESAVRVGERHARDAGREAVVDAARHDPAALGYARRALSQSPCAFCLMLASRGPVYQDASTALLRDGQAEPYHDNCACVAVPVFHRQRWPGRDEAERLEREWRRAGGTLADWRRHLAEQRQSERDRPAAA